jgi:transcriptional regulator with XRE-family HTH domain
MLKREHDQCIQYGVLCYVGSMHNDASPPRTSFAKTLRDLREERDWSRPVLAKRAGIHASTLARYELEDINVRTGKVDVPKPSTLRKIAKALGDGNSDKTRDALEKLFAAANYTADEAHEDEDPTERLDALEARVTDLGKTVDDLRRLVLANTPEGQKPLIQLLEDFLARAAATESQK